MRKLRGMIPGVPTVIADPGVIKRDMPDDEGAYDSTSRRQTPGRDQPVDQAMGRSRNGKAYRDVRRVDRKMDQKVMQPPFFANGIFQEDGGEQWCAQSNQQTVEFDQPVDWNYGTGTAIGWERWKLPAPIFDAAIHMDGIKNIHRRNPK